MSDVTSVDGTSIAYEVQGRGYPVILVDGAMCYRDAGPMRAIASQLAARNTVVLYDRRGRGASGDSPSYTVQREIEDLEALVAVAGEPVALFGISSGGALAAIAAAALGRKVTRLAVFEPPYMPTPARPAAAAYTEELSATLAAGDRDGAVTAFLARTGAPASAIEGMRSSPAWVGMTAIAATLAYDDAVMGDSSIPAAAKNVTARTLALAGGNSPEFLQWGARQLADEIRGGAFAVIEGQGHNVEPAVLGEHLRGFLAD